MAVGKIMKLGSGAALAAATLAMLAVPASAQDRGRWGGRGGDGAAQGNGGGGGGWRGGGDGGQNNGNGGGGRSFRSEQPAAAPAPAPAPQSQAQAQAPQRNWSRGGDNGGARWSRGGDNGAQDGGQRWNRGGNPQVQTAPAPQAPPRLQGERRTWWEGQQGRGPGNVQAERIQRGRDDGARFRGNPGVDRGTIDHGNRWQGNDNAWRGDRRNFAGNWNRDWRRDNRYDWRGYRNANRDIYRLGAYYAPYRNYSYRRLTAGFYLDALFFGSRYWIDDPWQYRLPDAYGPYRWVRYYDDALLVDTYSGEVVDVIYDFFW